jgi:two-component system response regulator YesN
MNTDERGQAQEVGLAAVPCDQGRILVVDDERSIRALFQMILAEELPGRRVDIASNGQEALDAFRSLHHAVLLMDLHMPVMDGHKAFCEIERHCRTGNWEMPAFVFCTGFAPPDALLDAIDASVTHCLLCKPVDTRTLVNAVRMRLHA